MRDRHSKLPSLGDEWSPQWRVAGVEVPTRSSTFEQPTLTSAEETRKRSNRGECVDMKVVLLSFVSVALFASCLIGCSASCPNGTALRDGKCYRVRPDAGTGSDPLAESVPPSPSNAGTVAARAANGTAGQSSPGLTSAAGMLGSTAATPSAIAGSIAAFPAANAGAAAPLAAGAAAAGPANGSMSTPAACAPTAEQCDNVDNDCDGTVDEGVTRTCGVNMGECKPGVLACHSGKWDDEQSQCQGAIGPKTEECDSARKDENCDGMPNEGCACAEGETMPCGNPTPPCKQGTLKCVNGKFSSTCEGEIKGSTEVCDGRDNDCNGSIDENVKNECGGCKTLQNPPGATCSAGMYDCQVSGHYQCQGIDDTKCDAVPRTGSEEKCGGGDEDCDGRVDEGLKNACGGPCDVRLANAPGDFCSMPVPGRPPGCAKQGEYACRSTTSVSCSAAPDAPTVGDCGCQWSCVCKPMTTKCTAGETTTIYSNEYPAGFCTADWLCMTRDGCNAGPKC